jgi:hypothetical protein
MKVLLVTAIALLAPISVAAATKFVDCTQTTDKGVVQIVKATISDESDKAEVRFYAKTAKCVENDSCGSGIYKKEVLPTTIRLTNVTGSSNASYTIVIDIDRSSLGVVTHATFRSAVSNSEMIATGTCKVRVDETKKLL